MVDFIDRMVLHSVIILSKVEPMDSTLYTYIYLSTYLPILTLYMKLSYHACRALHLSARSRHSRTNPQNASKSTPLGIATPRRAAGAATDRPN